MVAVCATSAAAAACSIDQVDGTGAQALSTANSAVVPSAAASPNTWSPTEIPLTSSPTSSTTPAPSNPGMEGKIARNLDGIVLCMMPEGILASTGFTPAA